MIPDLEPYEYAVFLISILNIFSVFLPALPGLIVAFVKRKQIKKKFKFALLSCVLSYGITIMGVLAVSAPFELINTFLTPVWESKGYKDFAYFFVNGEEFFSSILGVVLIVITSVVVPIKLHKRIPPSDEKAC